MCNSSWVDSSLNRRVRIHIGWSQCRCQKNKTYRRVSRCMWVTDKWYNIVGGKIAKGTGAVSFVVGNKIQMWPAMEKPTTRGKHWIYITWVQSSIVNTRTSITCATSNAHNFRCVKWDSCTYTFGCKVRFLYVYFRLLFDSVPNRKSYAFRILRAL